MLSSWGASPGFGFLAAAPCVAWDALAVALL